MMILLLVLLALVVVAAAAIPLILAFRRRASTRASVSPPERGFELPDDAGGEPEEPGPEEMLEVGEEVAGGAELEEPGPEERVEAGEELAAAAPVQFSVFHPQELLPGDWAKLLAYVHLAAARAEVERDRDQVLAGEPPVHRERAAPALLPIVREAVIRIVPELPGCRFNPPEASLMWLEDWHSALFRVQAHPQAPGFERGRAVNGRVAFYVETVLVGEVPIWALISDREELPAAPLAPTAPGDPFDKVFVSYSHRDGEVVDSLGRAYRVLGMQFLRDVDTLRSGERWNPRLLELIEEADIFQLYWSEEAGRSRYVTQEWRHALAQGRDHFIRPLYWRKPMPPPPAELAALHFAYLPGVEPG